MKHTLLLYLTLLLCPIVGVAQSFRHLVEEAGRFDNDYPRESVYVQMDDAAYVVGDTLWYKAYVVRSSTLRPTDISRVLYVELLNDGGNLLERSILEIDSAGQAHGCFGLVPPLRNGFYEIRAYTRAMTNWGQEAQFSRVFPLFELPKKTIPGDYTQLEVDYPKDKLYFSIQPERPYQFGSRRRRQLELFPEGGQYVPDCEQIIAYRLTDGMGAPAMDTIRVYTAQDSLICQSTPEHLGAGAFTLPAGVGRGIKICTSHRRDTYELPEPTGAAAVLHVNQEGAEALISVQVPPAVADSLGGQRMAIVALWRNQPRAMYPVELEGGQDEFDISLGDLGVGVNRLELVTQTGQVLASRLVFAHIADVRSAMPVAKVKVQQNAEEYEAFSPIALQFEVTDAEGRPMPDTNFAVAVHDADGHLVADGSASLQAQLLLCSELKGYVHNPEWYFQRDDATRRRALDLLMLTQGWRPQTLEQMCGQQAFNTAQPIEDRQIVRGRVMKDKLGKPEARRGIRLDLTLYNTMGEHRDGHAVTDSLGCFAFRPEEPLNGDWQAYFKTSSNNSGRELWSQIMLDQWFGGQPRAYSPLQYTLMPPHQQVDKRGKEVVDESPDVFEWEDTIPNLRKYYLKEARAKAKRKYHPQTFNRYTYGGGEGQGIKHSDVYVNVDLELQRAWDRGIEFSNMGEFIGYVIGDIHKSENLNLQDEYEIVEEELRRGMLQTDYLLERPESELTPETDWDRTEREERSDIYDGAVLSFEGNSFILRVNNGAGMAGNNAGHSMPEQIKSICISFDEVWANELFRRKYSPPEGESSWSHLDGIIYIYTRPDWYNFRVVKGQYKRTLHGFTTPTEFKGPNYRTEDDNPKDFRRTLYWNPSLTTDSRGRASAVFFGNARPLQRLSISVLGLTADGRVIELEQ